MALEAEEIEEDVYALNGAEGVRNGRAAPGRGVGQERPAAAWPAFFFYKT